MWCFLYQMEKEYSFLDYIMGGCQINFTVSLEMPKSNIPFAFVENDCHDAILSLTRRRSPLTSQAPTGIRALRGRSIISTLRAITNTSPPSGQWVTSSKTMTGELKLRGEKRSMLKQSKEGVNTCSLVKNCWKTKGGLCTADMKPPPSHFFCFFCITRSLPLVLDDPLPWLLTISIKYHM